MAEKTVVFRPFGARSFTITGSEHDAGVVGELERSGGRYQHDLTLFLRRRLRRDAVVVDGGAHVGVMTVLMAGLCPQGRVHAFEPAPGNRDHLARNVSANGLTNVTIEAAAVYDRDGEITLEISEAYPAGAHVAPGGTPVTSLRLDTWAEERAVTRLDLVKLDVEGAELAALAGAERTIARLRPVVVVECNPTALARFSRRSYGDLLARLRSLFAEVGILVPGGAVVPVLSERHLQLHLGEHGVVDLVGRPTRPALPERLRGAVRARIDLARLRGRHNARRPPARNLVVDPAVRIVVGAPVVSGPPGAALTIPVEVANPGPWWFSSAYAYQPVHLSYRLVDEAGTPVVPEGHRTPFAEPLGPGRSATVPLMVELPPAPGRYELVVTLVQESFAWFDELDPDATARVPVTVAVPEPA